MKRILLIEDEVSIAELQRDYLEINDFQVDVEHSGETGLQIALQEEYDLIILDIMLPKMNGFEICKQIRAVKDIPILLVSAKKEDIDKIRGLGLGADDYITKPFSPSELVARVKAHIARYERLSGNVSKQRDTLYIHGISIDQRARKVFINNEEVAFTTKEFDLLTFFVTHPNQVLNKEQLFERIWGLDSAGDLATVVVHIRKLREKIERDPAHPQYIETVWGAGYRFNV
ncbi:MULTISPECIES: response regulator transcription factor [Bacillus]|uniref:DNA-binding response regulator n=3 Tax=Bacillus cereus group TaxID=86661 RepID=A0AAP4Q3C1_BACTU|nr:MULTISPECIES: response regulator transcription factor [Bacillus]PAW43419.1 DNA-binding response regulator [Bacillus toyonensis]AEA18351.1 two-component response regulator [Bacillus thuringiensis serovar chinensis CT-43]AGG03476.1 DNA-binding response regulator [Bacillus thuringiensis serovar thuringiensis str. IS5056]ALC55143.1 transcriptional regulator [Bacillus cereus]ANC10980.1 transcriptional regulator [Bacillus cereus]